MLSELQHEPSAVVRLMKRGNQGVEVPVDILVNTLSGFQNLIYILASANKNLSIYSLSDVPEDIRENFVLHAVAARSGSYATPVLLKSIDRYNYISESTYTNLFRDLENFLASIVSENSEQISSLFPDLKSRNKALAEVRRLLNKLSGYWKLGFSIAGRDEVLISSTNSIKFVNTLLKEQTEEEAITTIIGILSSINFVDQKAELRYPPNQRLVSFYYPPELEPLLMKEKKKLIQVTGLFFLDQELYPMRGNANSISSLDLSPITLEAVSWQGRTFHIKKPTQVEPTLDETQQLFVVEEPDLGLHAFAQTRDQLIEEIAEQIAFMLDAYVKSDEKELASDAIKLREELIWRVAEVA